MKKLSRVIGIWILLWYCFPISAQNAFNLKDGRQVGAYCEACIQIIKEKPKEALFGVDIHQNGEVYISMTDLAWFEKLLSVANGLTVDVVSKDQYACSTPKEANGLFKGYVLPPLAKRDFKKNMRQIGGNHVQLLIGTLPKNLVGKELEGNLVALNGDFVCHYTRFINIARAGWELLPMGLYTDTLSKINPYDEGNETAFFTFSKRVQQVVSFQKSKTGYNQADIQPLFDSLEINNFIIKRVDIRAYSSVEGPLEINKKLMLGRGNAMIQALKKYTPSLSNTKIITAENWVDFLDDVKNTKFSYLSGLPKPEVKQKLTDVKLLQELEPILAKHRKAIVTVYLQKKTSFSVQSNAGLDADLREAISAKKIVRARQVLKEVMQRIEDNRLPDDYFNQIEIPMEKEFVDVVSDREVYKYLLKQTSEYAALEIFRELQKLDPNSRTINYNVCALSIFEWKFGGDEIDKKKLLADIQRLKPQGINESLVKRMLINYHILICEDYLNAGNYVAKDEALFEIRDLYQDVLLTDEEVYSLGKYFTLYSRFDWAEELIIPRVSNLDVNEDLLFYFINLSFYHPQRYTNELFKTALLNAVNLNPERYCNFFKPNSKGGASFQLLSVEVFKQLYCENCPQ